MKTFGLSLIVAAAFGVAFSSNAIACSGGGGGGGRGGGNYGRINGGIYESCNNGGYNGIPGGINYGRAYEPFHSTYYVQPGDTFYEIALKEYGTSGPTSHISRYNRLAPSAALVPGQMIWLPSISATGKLTASRAPRAANRNAAPAPVAKSTPKLNKAPATTVASKATVEDEPDRATVPTGSVIKLEGQSLGEKQGVVRLKISNVALPVEVVEWSADSTKVRLPKLDVDGSMKAELEVVRADGTIAATNAIELTTAPTNLASTN